MLKGFWKVHSGLKENKNNFTLVWLEELMVWLSRYSHHMENKKVTHSNRGWPSLGNLRDLPMGWVIKGEGEIPVLADKFFGSEDAIKAYVLDIKVWFSQLLGWDCRKATNPLFFVCKMVLDNRVTPFYRLGSWKKNVSSLLPDCRHGPAALSSFCYDFFPVMDSTFELWGEIALLPSVSSSSQ